MTGVQTCALPICHARVTNRQQGQCIGYFPNSKVHVSDPSLQKGKKKNPLPRRQALLSEGDLLDNGDDDTSSFSDCLDNDNGDEETLDCIGLNRIKWTSVD